MRSYNLNTEQAKQADNGANRITETGKYSGRFTRAEAVTSKQQTEGIEFAFEADNGQSADFLTLWTYNADGKELFGLKVLNALMTCMKVKTIAPQSGTVEKWDRESGGKTKVQGTIYPDLMNKPIGLLLQREEYAKADSTVGSKFNIYGCFESSTGLVASEILEKIVQPTKLARIVASLHDKPMQAPKSRAAPASQPSGQPGGFDTMDDDIPF